MFLLALICEIHKYCLKPTGVTRSCTKGGTEIQTLDQFYDKQISTESYQIELVNSVDTIVSMDSAKLACDALEVIGTVESTMEFIFGADATTAYTYKSIAFTGITMRPDKKYCYCNELNMSEVTIDLTAQPVPILSTKKITTDLKSISGFQEVSYSDESSEFSAYTDATKLTHDVIITVPGNTANAPMAIVRGFPVKTDITIETDKVTNQKLVVFTFPEAVMKFKSTSESFKCEVSNQVAQVEVSLAFDLTSLTFPEMTVNVTNFASLNILKAENQDSGGYVVNLESGSLMLTDSSKIDVNIVGTSANIYTRGENAGINKLTTMTETTVQMFGNLGTKILHVNTFQASHNSQWKSTTIGMKVDVDIFTIDDVNVTFSGITLYSDKLSVVTPGQLIVDSLECAVNLIVTLDMAQVPLIKATKTVTLFDNEYSLDYHNDAPEPDDAFVEKFIGNEYHLIRGPNIDCTQWQLRFSNTRHQGFRNDNSVLEPWCRKIDGEFVAGYKVVDVPSHTNLSICYYDSDPSGCDAAEYKVIPYSDIARLNDNIYAGTQNVTLAFAQDMPDAVNLEILGDSHTVFHMMVALVGLGETKKVNVKYTTSTQEQVRELKLVNVKVNLAPYHDEEAFELFSILIGQNACFTEETLQKISFEHVSYILVPVEAFQTVDISHFNDVVGVFPDQKNDIIVTFLEESWKFKTDLGEFSYTPHSAGRHTFVRIDSEQPMSMRFELSGTTAPKNQFVIEEWDNDNNHYRDRKGEFHFEASWSAYVKDQVLVSLEGYNNPTVYIANGCTEAPVAFPYAETVLFNYRGSTLVEVPDQDVQHRKLTINLLETALTNEVYLKGFNFLQDDTIFHVNPPVTDDGTIKCHLGSVTIPAQGTIRFENIYLKEPLVIGSQQYFRLVRSKFEDGGVITMNVDMADQDVMLTYENMSLVEDIVPRMITLNVKLPSGTKQTVTREIIKTLNTDKWKSAFGEINCAGCTAEIQTYEDHIDLAVTPGSAPTSKPTSKPTSAPTSKPTSAPTSKPTSAPTSAPTSKPTQPYIPTTQTSIALPTDIPVHAGSVAGASIATVMVVGFVGAFVFIVIRKFRQGAILTNYDTLTSVTNV